MKKLIWTQLAMGLIPSALIAQFVSTDAAKNFFAGAVLVTINLNLHWLIWGYLIQQKKLIAFAVSLIVFKYAIFAIIIYKVLGEAWANPLWFCIGVGSFLVSSVLVAVTRKENVV